MPKILVLVTLALELLILLSRLLRLIALPRDMKKAMTLQMIIYTSWQKLKRKIKLLADLTNGKETSSGLLTTKPFSSGPIVL